MMATTMKLLKVPTAKVAIKAMIIVAISTIETIHAINVFPTLNGRFRLGFCNLNLINPIAINTYTTQYRTVVAFTNSRKAALIPGINRYTKAKREIIVA